jgi:predicted Abi (CAAX) family protease
MWGRLRAVVAIIGCVSAACWLAPPAVADEGDAPCPLSLALMCHFLPMAPGLDGDVDLTQQQPAPDPQRQPAPSLDLPPIDPCAMTRCI